MWIQLEKMNNGIKSILCWTFSDRTLWMWCTLRFLSNAIGARPQQTLVGCFAVEKSSGVFMCALFISLVHSLSLSWQPYIGVITWLWKKGKVKKALELGGVQRQNVVWSKYMYRILLKLGKIKAPADGYSNPYDHLNISFWWNHLTITVFIFVVAEILKEF